MPMIIEKVKCDRCGNLETRVKDEYRYYPFRELKFHCKRCTNQLEIIHTERRLDLISKDIRSLRNTLDIFKDRVSNINEAIESEVEKYEHLQAELRRLKKERESL